MFLKIKEFFDKIFQDIGRIHMTHYVSPNYIKKL